MYQDINDIQEKFWSIFITIALCIAVLLLVYFSNFNGALSDNISEWADFSTFISNFSIVLLTALNIWVFYKLTYHVARHEETERLFELRKR